LKFFKFLIFILIFVNFSSAEQTIVEPKIIEYKGVKEDQLKKVENQVYNLSQKQKSLEEKISQLEKIKNISPQDKQLLEVLITDIEDIKRNQENLNKQVNKLYSYVNNALLLQNIIQFVMFVIFIVLVYLLYKYKKSTGKEIKQINEKIENVREKEESDIIMNLTEKAKEDPKAAEILKIYLSSRRYQNEV
jgi:predicted PurR-regulated permease PerM